MGLLIDGVWKNQWYDTKKTKGHFVRSSSSFRGWLGKDFPIEKGRYHLFVSYACPWAHRVIIMRKLKQLEPWVSMSVVDAYMGDNGWTFSRDKTSDYEHINFLHQIYTLCEKNYTGRVTVPVLWDRVTKKIINNESADIVRMFNGMFNGVTGNVDDYYPESLRNEIDEINEFIYSKINNGVYKVGFATDQTVYEQEVVHLFEALDFLDNHLKNQRYLVGSSITEADIRLFTTLVRFDAVYVGHFKCNLKQLREFTNLYGYVCDMYQTKDLGETVHMDHIKEHYYLSHPTINPNQIVPKGPLMNFNLNHGRAKLN